MRSESLGLESIIHSSDLSTFSQIGAALWTRPETSEQSLKETLFAISLQDLTPERMVERASVALLERAQRGGSVINAQENLGSLFQIFFRLPIETRFALVALHQGSWSYERLTRILNLNTRQLEVLVWAARLELASSSRIYPGAPATLGPDCPEFEVDRPWAQRYLDREIHSRRDQLFLHHHLLSCTSCSRYFVRLKEAYFEAGRAISIALNSSHSEGQFQSQIRELQNVLSLSFSYRNPSQAGFLRSLFSFFRRPDIQWALFIFLSVIFVICLKK